MKIFDIQKFKLNPGDIKDSKLPDGFNAVKVVLKASHVGYINKNYFMYEDGEATTSSLNSWVKPFRKPVITHHNKENGEPLGRVLNARREAFVPEEGSDATENIPTGVVILDAIISDDIGIEKILKEEYMTVSVNSSPDSIKCSICNKEILGDGLCEHKRGEKYEDKLCYWKIGKRTYKEVSFVNDPADASDTHFAGVVSIESPDGELPEFAKELVDSVGTESYIILMDSNNSNAEMIASNVEDDDVTDWTEDDVKLIIWVDTEVEKTLTEAGDAIATDGHFCGPTDETKGRKTLPLNSKSHYLTTIKLIDKYRGPGSKAKVKATIERRGKAMGWTTEVVEDVTMTEQLSGIIAQRDALQVRIDAILEEQIVKDKITELETKVEDGNKTISSLQVEVEQLKEQIEDVSSKSTNALLEKENTKLYLTVHRLRAELLTNMEIVTGEHKDFLTAEDPVKVRDEYVKNLMNERNSAELADMVTKLALKTQFGTVVRPNVPDTKIESPGLDREPTFRTGLFSKIERETGGQKLSRLSDKYST